MQYPLKDIKGHLKTVNITCYDISDILSGFISQQILVNISHLLTAENHNAAFSEKDDEDSDRHNATIPDEDDENRVE